jgi:hypothetical protein
VGHFLGQACSMLPATSGGVSQAGVAHQSR